MPSTPPTPPVSDSQTERSDADKDFVSSARNAPREPKAPVVLEDDDLAAATGAASTKLLESVANGKVYKAKPKIEFQFYRPTHGHGG